MRSPDELDLAKREILDELEQRVGRFARGADLSERLACERGDRLAARHGAWTRSR